VFGEVLQVVGHVLTGAGGRVEVVDLIDNDEVRLGIDEHLAYGIADVGGVVARLDRGESEETREFRRQLAR
jgi:hypothetical protein